MKPDDLNKLLAHVHDKLGNVSDTTRIGFHVDYKMAGSTITPSYSTKFQLAEGEEDFVWLKSGTELHLLHYNIKSHALDQFNLQ